MEGKILNVVSEQSYLRHKEYADKFALKYSILEKSDSRIPKITGVSELWRSSAPTEIKREAIACYSEYAAHRLYFSSFSDGLVKCAAVKSEYSSENAFLYSLLCQALKFGEGFLFIMCGKRRMSVLMTRDNAEAYSDSTRVPVLAVDLFEHAYFADYGFDREAYLRRALAHLDLSKIS